MSAAKIRKGDKVVVLSGRDKGKTGEITAAMPKDSKVVVSVRIFRFQALTPVN